MLRHGHALRVLPVSAVEEVRLAEVEAHGDLVAGLSGLRVQHPRHQLGAAEVGEDQGLVAERLGQGDRELDVVDVAFLAGVEAVAAGIEVVGAEAEGDPVAGGDAAAELARQRERDAVAEGEAAVVDGGLAQVHRRRADEAGDVAGGGALEDLVGGAGLLDIAVAHDDDAVGQRHRLDLVVGDVDDGGRDLGVQLLDLGAHLGAQLGVEVGERLVEEEDVGVAHDGAAHGDALALAAGELRGAAVHERLEAEDGGGLGDAGVDLGLRAAGDLEREAEVLAHGHVRVERVGLEDHGDVARARRQVVDHPAADADLAAGDLLEPRDHAQRRGLAAAGGADQRDELAVGDLEVDAVDDLERRRSA